MRRLTRDQESVRKQMTVFKGDEGWEFLVPVYESGGETHFSCGPYGTKAEADEDRRGLAITYERMIANGEVDANWAKSSRAARKSAGSTRGHQQDTGSELDQVHGDDETEEPEPAQVERDCEACREGDASIETGTHVEQCMQLLFS